MTDSSEATASGPGASIPVATLPNLRDLGGWRTDDGREVKAGLIYRSTDLSRLDQAGRDAVEALGVATVYDFRSIAERTSEPDVSLDGVHQVALDVLADSPTAIPGNLTKVLSDPATLAAAEAQLGADGPQRLMLNSYAYLVTLPSARASYQLFYRGLLGGHPSPSLFHCTTGKDRTGWASASFLSLMGVPRENVFAEYLLTNQQLIPAMTAIFDAFESAGGDPATLLAVLGVDRTYLERAFATVDEEFGSIEAYFAEGLGIDETDQELLRSRYLEG